MHSGTALSPSPPSPLVQPLPICMYIKNLFPRKLKGLKGQGKLEHSPSFFVTTKQSPTARSLSLVLNQGNFAPPLPSRAQWHYLEVFLVVKTWGDATGI